MVGGRAMRRPYVRRGKRREFLVGRRGDGSDEGVENSGDESPLPVMGAACRVMRGAWARKALSMRK